LKQLWRLAVLGSFVCLPSCRPGEPPVATLEIEPVSLELGFSEMASVELTWEIRRPVEGIQGDLRVFVHLLEQPGEVLRTFDHLFPEQWSVGQSVSYDLKLYQSVLGPPLSPGTYSLTAGIYDEAGTRWPLEVKGERIDRAEYVIAEVDVGSQSAAPMFRFSESWKPIEAGLDRQVLGRRWLTDHGTISATEITQAGTLWLTLIVPSVNPGVHRLVLDPGYEQTRVLVRGDCAGSEIELTGEGWHELEIPVSVEESDHASAECDLVFEPNFHLVTPGTADRRAIVLETLAWRPVKSHPDTAELSGSAR